MQNNYYTTAATPQRGGAAGYDMNHLYLSPSQQQVNRQGMFLKRTERIDWRRIAAVDIDRISREMDFQTLQDNLDNITLCNIDAEVDTRVMDPNFIKLYKMAQLTIEYLLICQDQITSQLGDYEQLKNKSFHDHEKTRQHIERLEHELAETKKESKKRRKMLETQQRMLVAQNSNYHTCPVCTHAFLSVAYLQAHLNRRHPDYDASRRREHDVDIEKEMRRLKDELNKKDQELRMIQTQKSVDEEKIRDRDVNIRQLKEEKQTLTTRITILENNLSQMRSIPHGRSPSPHRHDAGLTDLIKENRNLHADVEQLKRMLGEAEQQKRLDEQEINKLQKQVKDLDEHLRSLQKTPGDSAHLTQELLSYKKKYHEEKSLREKLEVQLHGSVPHPTDPKPTTVVPKGSTDPPVQPAIPSRPSRPEQAADIFLTDYCRKLPERLKYNPKFLTKYREEAKKVFLEELQENGTFGITETETRLTDLDFRTKMECVLRTRHNIQEDLPNFERIRENVSRILDRRVAERLDVRRSTTSIRSTGSKLVTFEDQQSKHSSPKFDSTKRFTTDQYTTGTTAPTKPKSDHIIPKVPNESDDDVTISNANESEDDIQPTQPGVVSQIRPSPRKNVPTQRTTHGVAALVNTNIGTPKTNETTTISALPRQHLPKTAAMTNKTNSDSESGSPVPPYSRTGVHPLNVNDKRQIIEQKLRESSMREKPTSNAVPQGFQPSRELPHDDDGDDNESFTTLHTNPAQKPVNGHQAQLSGRESMNNNLLSSGEMSHTYDSLWKSQAGKGGDIRRPLTADSTKTSNMDSDDNRDEEDSH